MKNKREMNQECIKKIVTCHKIIVVERKMKYLEDIKKIITMTDHKTMRVVVKKWMSNTQN